MSTYMSKEVLEGLAGAKDRAQKSSRRLSVHVGDVAYPIATLSDTGFVLRGEEAPTLRGQVDIYDGPAHLYQALVTTSYLENGNRVYDFKRATAPQTGPAKDFATARAEVAGLIEQTSL